MYRVVFCVALFLSSLMGVPSVLLAQTSEACIVITAKTGKTKPGKYCRDPDAKKIIENDECTCVTGPEPPPPKVSNCRCPYETGATVTSVRKVVPDFYEEKAEPTKRSNDEVLVHTCKTKGGQTILNLVSEGSFFNSRGMCDCEYAHTPQRIDDRNFYCVGYSDAVECIGGNTGDFTRTPERDNNASYFATMDPVLDNDRLVLARVDANGNPKEIDVLSVIGNTITRPDYIFGFIDYDKIQRDPQTKKPIEKRYIVIDMWTGKPQKNADGKFIYRPPFALQAPQGGLYHSGKDSLTTKDPENHADARYFATYDPDEEGNNQSGVLAWADDTTGGPAMISKNGKSRPHYVFGDLIPVNVSNNPPATPGYADKLIVVNAVTEKPHLENGKKVYRPMYEVSPHIDGMFYKNAKKGSFTEAARVLDTCRCPGGVPVERDPKNKPGVYTCLHPRNACPKGLAFVKDAKNKPGVFSCVE